MIRLGFKTIFVIAALNFAITGGKDLYTYATNPHSNVAIESNENGSKNIDILHLNRAKVTLEDRVAEKLPAIKSKVPKHAMNLPMERNNSKLNKVIQLKEGK